MRKITLVFCLLFFTLSFENRTFAQDTGNTQPVPKAQDTAKPPAQPVHYYHIDFLVEELGSDGKPTNSRTYSTTICTETHSTVSLRTGSKIPIATGSFEASSKASTQFQYIDIGVNFDVHNAHEVNQQLAFVLTADLSSVASYADLAAVHEPIIRQNAWQASVLIPVGKPTVVFKSDNLDSKGSTQVLVTATPLQ